MSANAGKLTLKFEVDIADLEVKISKAKNAISGLGPALNSTNASLQQTSQNTVTAAVRFQTLTQGALNLTTSFAQTATSFSNIQRAQTGVAASTVALQRAEDLLEKKMLRLNDERNKSVKNLDKITLLTNELSTAEQDLAVKRQKLIDATDQANDTNILFGINLLNVGFSAIQTGKSMIDMARSSTVAAGGVGLLTASVGVLRGALTFLQAHPVFLVVTLALIAWEAGFSKIIKGITGVDYSIQALTTSALGLDKMQSSTQILGSEFHNTGEEIQFVSDTMDSTETSMVTSLQSIGTSLKILKSEFTNFSSDVQLAGQIMIGSISTQGMSVLDQLKLNAKLESEALSDINFLLDKGHSLTTATHIVNQDIIEDMQIVSQSLSMQYQLGKLTTEEYSKQLHLLNAMILSRMTASKVANEQIKQERLLNEISKKNHDDSKLNSNTSSESNRGIVLTTTGEDIGEAANSMDLNSALLLGAIQKSQRQFNRTSADRFVSDFDKLSKTQQDIALNYIGPGLTGFNAGRLTGSKTALNLANILHQAQIKVSDVPRYFSLEEQRYNVRNVKGVGGQADAAIAQAKSARNIEQNSVVRASAEFYSNLKKIDAWNNSIRGQEIKVAASLITGEAAWFSGGNEKKARKLSQSETNTLSLAGALGFRPSNIDKVDGIINTTVDSMIAESSAFLNSMTGSIPGSMISSVFSAGGSLIRNIQQGYGSKLYQAGSSGRYALQQNINREKNSAAAGLFNNVVSRFNGGNYGEYDATVMSTLLGATFAHPEIAQEYTSFQTKIAPILGITHNEFTSVLSESTRGYSEIDDRMRYKGRLEQISTGATVF